MMNVVADESELAILQLLDGIVRDASVRAAIGPIAARVEAQSCFGLFRRENEDFFRDGEGSNRSQLVSAV